MLSPSKHSDFSKPTDLSRSSKRNTAIDIDGLAGHEITQGRREKQHGADDIHFVFEPFDHSIGVTGATDLTQ
jgi:hypothetical protein